MLQIGETIVSFDLLDKYFVCDLAACKGACCIHGDSGAPLEDEEVSGLSDVFPKVKKYMQSEGVLAIEKLGTSVLDSDGDIVTPLIEGKECAYTYFDNGVAKCSIEKAYLNGEIKFRKPISCFLYPVRLTKYPSFTAVNYHKWEICDCALKKGMVEKVSLYAFLKEPLIRKFGKDWYKELEIAAGLYLSEKA